MAGKTSFTVTPTVKTVEYPTVSIDQWGSSTVSYQPMQISYFSVTLPTVAPEISTGWHPPIDWLRHGEE